MNSIEIHDTLRTRHPAITAWMRLVRVFQQVDHASTEQMRAWDLSIAQFDVLVQVGAHEGLTQQELADHLLVTKGNVCQLLDRMTRAGLVERRQEGRANRLFLTAGGRALFAEALPTQEALIVRLFSVLSREEQQQLGDLLRKLDHALGH